MSKPILVTGATGNQGSCVVDALLASPQAADFTILAVTRDANSESATKLAAKGSSVRIVQGNLNDLPTVFKDASAAASAPVWGVFSVQASMTKGGSLESEERQGKALVDESLKNGVKCFVYSSVDRGGDRSSSNPTDVPHFQTKHRIEQHLQSKVSANHSMSWTVLRPTAFFENMTPDFMGKGFATMWKQALGDKPLQLISTADIGIFAAQAFSKPDEFNGKFISLAGDDLAFAQANKVFKELYGKDIPTTYGFIGSAMLWGIKELGVMFAWFKREGYGADIAELRKMHPNLLDFRAWLKTKSGFRNM